MKLKRFVILKTHFRPARDFRGRVLQDELGRDLFIAGMVQVGSLGAVSAKDALAFAKELGYSAPIIEEEASFLASLERARLLSAARFSREASYGEA